MYICIQYIYQQLQLCEGVTPLRTEETEGSLPLKSNGSVITAHPARGQRTALVTPADADTSRKLTISEATLLVAQKDSVG